MAKHVKCSITRKMHERPHSATKHTRKHPSEGNLTRRAGAPNGRPYIR